MIVTPAWRFGVSRQINKRFENRRVDYAMHGRKLKVPNDVGPQPDFNKRPIKSPAAVEKFYHRRRFYTARVKFGRIDRASQ